MTNPHAAWIQATIEADIDDIGTATALVFPFTQLDVYAQIKSLGDFYELVKSGTLVPTLDLQTGFDVVGFNCVIAILTGPFSTPEDFKYLAESLYFFIYLSEEANGYIMNPVIGLVNDFYTSNAATVQSICAGASTSQEAADCAWGLMRLKGINVLTGIVVPTEIDDAMDDLQTAVSALTISTSADFVAIADTFDSIRRQGENDQPPAL